MDFSHTSYMLSYQPDYSFAFNEKNYSDRILTMVIMSDVEEEGGSADDPVELKTSEEGGSADDPAELKTSDEGSSSGVNLDRKRKRSSEEINERGNDADDKQEEETTGGRLEKLPPSGLLMPKNQPPRVRTIHISSPILAAKSVYFEKLFSKGTEVQREVTVHIHESEEAALVDLLRFMYCNTLSITTPTGLLDVLMAADQFEVVSCMRYCCSELQILHMTTETALLYLDLPSKIFRVGAVKPLIDAAKMFLDLRFRDITKFQEEALSLPLLGIKVVLSSDDLRIASEDAVYDFALKWGRKHYSELQERREIWNSHLCYLIRFPCMTCMKLKKILMCNDMDQDLASKLVLEALFYKAEAPYRQRAIAGNAGDVFHHRYVERAYKYRPVKAIMFERPHQQCVVYLDLKRDECALLFPAGKVYSQPFHLGGRELFLSAHCNMDPEGAFHCLGFFLGMIEEEAEPLAIDHEFSVRMRPGNEYVSKHKGHYILTSGVMVGCRNLCGVPWIPFLDPDSLCFINEILHLRAEITIKE